MDIQRVNSGCPCPAAIFEGLAEPGEGSHVEKTPHRRSGLLQSQTAGEGAGRAGQSREAGTAALAEGQAARNIVEIRPSRGIVLRAIRPGLALVLLTACAPGRAGSGVSGSVPHGSFGEHARVLDIHPGVTATIVSPAAVDTRKPVELILYALPNGNTTAQTMGRRMAEGIDWHFDIQHIGAQTRVLRKRGMEQAVVAYLEADRRSWPAWRSTLGYDRANPRIVAIVDEIRSAIGDPADISVILTGHSGGGSFTWGFIDGQDSLPDWLDRIAFLDSNYSFEPRHGTKIVEWLRRDPAHTLVVLAYDDREITVDGKKVVSDSGGTWRASGRMIANLEQSYRFNVDTLGEFIRHRTEQIEILLHPNPSNRILHTEMIGEMNGYMHALLVRRSGYTQSVLARRRAYEEWVEPEVVLPPAKPREVPPRKKRAMTGSAFIESIATLSRTAREEAIRRELMAGNIPSFLRRLSTIETSATDSLGVLRTLRYEVMPDYLAIGSDGDFVRMPMTPYTAQAFCDAFGFVLPTRKMVSDIWRSARVQLEPVPLTELRESPQTFLQHHRIVESQLGNRDRGSLVAGNKKDVVITERLLERPGRVAIFGWHRTNGEPIQPLYVGHVDWYVDYSHGVRPVRRAMSLDGVTTTFDKVIGNSSLRQLVTDESAATVTRY